MNISNVILVASLFLSFASFSQSVNLMGGAPEGILFRGMPNVIQINDNLGENRTFHIKFTGGSIETIEANDENSSEGRYVLRPTSANMNPEVIVFDNEGNEMSRVAFEVKRIPDSEVKFATENGEFSKSISQLIVSNHYPYFENTQEIAAWKVRIEGHEVIEGKGSRLSEQAMYQLSKLESGVSFELEAFVLDQEGVGRLKNMTFTVN